MKTIHKYQLAMADEQLLQLPMDSKPLCVQMQNGMPHVWVMIDMNQPMYGIYKFYTHGTGHNFNHNANYLDTYQMDGGGLIFHVFWELPI